MAHTKELETYNEVCSKLAYNLGLVEHLDQTQSPVQRQIFSETKRQIKGVNAIYFSGDIPVIYFKLLNNFSEEAVKIIHRRVWKQIFCQRIKRMCYWICGTR